MRIFQFIFLVLPIFTGTIACSKQGFNPEGTSIFNAYVSPDEDFLIGCVDGRKNNINPGFASYYIFFRYQDDYWSEGIPFGPEINMKGSNAISASVSPDGRYLFFAAQKISNAMEEKSNSTTLSNMLEVLNSPQNGNYDIYWVDAGIIEKYRQKAILNKVKK